MFFHRFSFRRLHRSKLLVSMVLVVFAVGAIPRTGCICADGHYEFFCRRHVIAGETASCSCCHAKRRCCQTNSCCNHSSQPASGERLPSPAAIGAQGCCHPVMSVPSVAPKESEKEPARRTLSAIDLVADHCLLTPVVKEAKRDGCLRPPDRPITDLVIALHRLTI